MEVSLYNSTYCRLCAENNPNGVFLYSPDDSEIELSTLINRYLPCKISDDGKLPRTICPGCNIQLQATVQFFDLLVEGQEKLRLLWKSQLEHLKRTEKQPGIQQFVITQQDDSDDGSKIVIQILADGSLYPADHEMALKMEGLEKPRRKRGRPKKQVVTEAEERKEEEKEPEPLDDGQDIDTGDDDPDGRRRRKRKVPVRFKEAVQGKELERIFREEGVIDEDEPDDVEDDETELNQENTEVDGIDCAEVIGHLENPDGQDTGELIIVNKNKSRGKPRGKRKKTRFVCDICGRGFQFKRRFLMHKAFHIGVQFECAVCNERFPAREPFDMHQKATGHVGEGIVEGSKEEEEVVNLETKEQFPCELCDKSFQCKQNHMLHVKAIHDGEKPFTCEVCGKSFSYQNSLKSHMSVHEEVKTDKGIPCEICGKVFNHTSSLIYHKEADHNNGRRFVCNKCGKGFKHKQLLQRHQLVHSESRPFVCKICGATFKSRANLQNHQPTHTGEKKYTCEMCNQQFAHKTSLTLHYRWHSGLKPYKCEVCGKSFSQNGNLQEHLRIHTGEKPFSCEFCGRKFTTSSQFKLHVKRHTGERPWVCEFCNKSFLHKDTWKCHTRRHKGERPFQCHHCARSFTEQWALKKHLRLHTGEKPYTCGICGKAFADCSNLTKHKKVHRAPKEENLGSPVNPQVWNIIRTQLSKEDERGDKIQGEGVEQIIYVTYQDSEDPNEGRTLHIVNPLQSQAVRAETARPPEQRLDLNELAEQGSLSLGDAHAFQVTDSNGNPIQITVQQTGQELQITTADGQPIHVTTPDGIPLQVAASQVSDFASAIPDALQHVSVEQSHQTEDGDTITPDDMPPLVGTEDGIEFTTNDGQKLQLVTYVDNHLLASEYLSTS